MAGDQKLVYLHAVLKGGIALWGLEMEGHNLTVRVL